MRSLYKIVDKRRFLIAAMTELAGSAHISFEGNLARTSLFQSQGVSIGETPVLKRNTLWPVQEFTVLPLEVDGIKQIMAAVGGTVSRGIIHIQIEKFGQLQLGLHDSFDPQAMFLGRS